MTTSNKLIQASDYNNIHTTVSNIVGSGAASRGYGQVVNSSAVPTHKTVSQFDWDLLRFDLVNARIHQTGSGSLIDVNENEIISASAVNPYSTTASTADSTRFSMAAGQFQTEFDVINASREWGAGTIPTNWSVEINAIFRSTFPSPAAGRYFFNSGGEIRISSSRIDPPSGRSFDEDQSNFWSVVLQDPTDSSKPDTQAFGGIYSAISTGGITRPAQTGLNYYALTTAWTVFYSRINSTPYTANRYQLEARVDVANNSTGTASYIEFRVRFIDGYVDRPSGRGPRGFPREVGPEDNVDGLFSIILDEKKAASSDFNPITTVLTTASNELSRNTITVNNSQVPYVSNGMKAISGLVGSGKTIVSSSVVGDNRVFVLNANTDSVVPSGTSVTFQNTFSVDSPVYTVEQGLQGS